MGEMKFGALMKEVGTGLGLVVEEVRLGGIRRFWEFARIRGKCGRGICLWRAGGRK